MSRHSSVTIILVVMAVIIGFIPRLLPSYYVSLLTQVLIFSLFALSLDLVLGYTGLPSLGHAAFFGVAGYFAGILNAKVLDSFWVALASGLAASVLCASIFGLLVLRTKGPYFLMITLALGQMLWGVAFKWRSLTGGDDGLPGIPRPNFGILHWDLNGTINYYYFVLVCFLIAFLLLYLVAHSPFTHVLKGIRENEKRMTTLGFNVWLYKYLAFILSGLFGGLAGILHVYYNNFVSPADLSVVMSTEVFLMVLVGGPGTLLGPILGAAVIVLLSNFISIYTERWVLILGLIYVATILYAPKGIYVPIKHSFYKWLRL